MSQQVRTGTKPGMDQKAATNPNLLNDNIYSPIVELRQYTLHPGKRDVLIEFFEKYFIEKQEETGAELIGQFRDLQNPDLFVWLRGFPDMETRGLMLEEFYSSPIWRAHRQEANDTMIDSDNVLLLHEAWPRSGFNVGRRVPPRSNHANESLVAATICYLDLPPSGKFLEFFRKSMEPILAKARGQCIAAYVTHPTPNNYPTLSVREGENVFVWFARFANKILYEEYVRPLGEDSKWRGVQVK